MKHLALCVGVATMLCLANVEAFDFAVGGLVGLLSLFVVPGVGLAWVVWGIARRRRERVVRGVTLLLAAVVSLMLSRWVTRAQMAASKERGDELCRSLEMYRQAKGRHPERLEALVPEFLATLPPTRVSLFRKLPCFYGCWDDGREFRIGFNSTVFLQCSRSSRGEWRTDD